MRAHPSRRASPPAAPCPRPATDASRSPYHTVRRAASFLLVQCRAFRHCRHTSARPEEIAYSFRWSMCCTDCFHFLSSWRSFLAFVSDNFLLTLICSLVIKLIPKTIFAHLPKLVPRNMKLVIFLAVEYEN